MSYGLIYRKRTKARVRHRCEWCELSVLPGCTYVREKSAYDGRIQSFAFHEACVPPMNEYFADEGDGPFPGQQEMPYRLLYDLERKHAI